jgi:hypothetical protein
LHDFRAQIEKEDNPANLRELVMHINELLDLIEEQAAKLKPRGGPKIV